MMENEVKMLREKANEGLVVTVPIIRESGTNTEENLFPSGSKHKKAVKKINNTNDLNNPMNLNRPSTSSIARNSERSIADRRHNYNFNDKTSKKDGAASSSSGATGGESSRSGKKLACRTDILKSGK